MYRNTKRLLLFSAWGIIILNIIYLVGLILPLITIQEHEWRPVITSYYTIDTSDSILSEVSGFVFFLASPLLLILFACFHDCASRSVKIFSGISLSLIISSTALRTLSYIGQFGIRDFNIHSCIDDSPLYLTYSLFNDFITSVYFMAVTVFVGLAELFLVPVFSKSNKIEKNIRLTLIIAGIFNLLGALIFIVNKEEISALFVLISFLVFTIFIILIIKFFGQF